MLDGTRFKPRKDVGDPFGSVPGYENQSARDERENNDEEGRMGGTHGTPHTRDGNGGGYTSPSYASPSYPSPSPRRSSSNLGDQLAAEEEGGGGSPGGSPITLNLHHQ